MKRKKRSQFKKKKNACKKKKGQRNENCEPSAHTCRHTHRHSKKKKRAINNSITQERTKKDTVGAHPLPSICLDLYMYIDIYTYIIYKYKYI